MKKIILISLIVVLPIISTAQFSWVPTSTVITLNQKIRLQSGQYDLIFQSDGNLVLYQGSRSIWSTKTVGSGAVKLIFQNDGNLVLYNSLNVPKWSTGTNGNPGSSFYFQNDGNLVIYKNNGTVAWKSNTAAITSVFPYSDYNTNSTFVDTRIINNHFSTDDIVVIDYNIVDDFGADNTGLLDVSNIIKDALLICSLQGGGTVWVPKGKYRIGSKITIPENCTLRGDWRDPEGIIFNDVNDYGTVMLIDLDAGENGDNAFVIESNAGILGLTIYYPNQNSTSPIPYNYTIKCVGYQSCVIKNVTLINSYNGIATSESVHEVYTFKNIKATCLKTGITSKNSADVDVYEDITLSNYFWLNAPTDLNPPNNIILNNLTKTDAVGLNLSQLEWPQFLRVKIADLNIGIITIPGPRISFVGSFIQTEITNCNICIQFDNYDTRWGPCFVNCVFSGDNFSIKNNVSGGNVLFNQCTFLGQLYGSNISITNNNTTSLPPTSSKIEFDLIPKVTREFIYNVGKAPYNCPRVLGNYQGCLPVVDATPIIQLAINQANLEGGGVVYLPPGWYRLDGSLNIPSNVELRGASSIPNRDVTNSINGTTLFIYNGYNTIYPNTNTAFINMNGDNAGVSGIKFFYPDRNFRFGDIPFPYTIRGNGNKNYIKNISIINGYNGIDFSTNICNDFYVERIIGMCTKNFINIGGNSNNGILKNTLSNPTSAIRIPYNVQNWLTNSETSTSTLINFTKANEIFINVDPNSNFNGNNQIKISNVFAYGARFGLINGKPGTVVNNIGCDNLGNGYCVVASEYTVLLNLMRYNGYGAVYGISPNGFIQLYNQNDLY